jgi:hypothetical protein
MNKPKHVGYMAGDKLLKNPDGSYMLTLRQAILIAFQGEHTAPTRAIDKLAEAIATAYAMRRLRLVDAGDTRLQGCYDRDLLKTEIFAAWLKGKFEPVDAATTIWVQELAEQADQRAHGAMEMFYAMARRQPHPDLDYRDPGN